MSYLKPALCPDCQQNPPDHHDGSGWYCSACKAYADNISAVIEQNIREQRMTDAGERADHRREQHRQWYARNKVTVQAKRKVYNRLYKRGMRGQELAQARLAEAA